MTPDKGGCYDIYYWWHQHRSHFFSRVP